MTNRISTGSVPAAMQRIRFCSVVPLPEINTAMGSGEGR
jgi:hypothetical protein